MSDAQQDTPEQIPRSTLGGPQPGAAPPPPPSAPSPPPTDAEAEAKRAKDAADLELAEKLIAEGGGDSRRPTPSEGDEDETEEQREERRRIELGLPRDAPEQLVRAAEDDLDDDGTAEGKAEANQDEVAVLDFLLGPTKALEYDLDAIIDTDKGPGVLTFHFRQIRDKRIEELEAEHTTGEGAFAQIDRVSLNAAKVAEAVLYLKDRTGHKTKLVDEEFLGQGIGDPFDAVKARFQYQPGIIDRVAAEIDAAAGMSNGRVGFAKIAKSPSTEEGLSSAVGNS